MKIERLSIQGICRITVVDGEDSSGHITIFTNGGNAVGYERVGKS